ncbi:MAG: hypothetical protein IPK50_20870 [Fibrobacterota bacterium]|nr:hypothetical protein [Fibrobacterota bacterium]QQS04704.1 MAG: hypothetical protein IPK50_20870 [Fibrobacterota bacterium]
MSLGADAYRRGAVLTAGPIDLVRKCLEAALREAITLCTKTTGDLDRLRKLLSLARQCCRTEEPGIGKDLSELCAHILVKVSSQDPGAMHEAIGLLSSVVGGFRDWHTTNSGGTLRPWSIGSSN